MSTATTETTTDPHPTMTTQTVVPVAVTAADKIEGLRQWASRRCLLADWGAIRS
jgi:hypothetical protein